jgi:multidrug efflux pump subunit AcrA (membrane-fusion protein)
MDPGGFARPGTSIVSVVDRKNVRIVADVPEADFDIIGPDTLVAIRVVATGKTLSGKISRRSPAADESTRTIHFEIDLADPKREIPVGTTAELAIDVGEAVPATEVPLIAASIRGEKAHLFQVEGEVAKKSVLKILGESGGSLFVDPAALKAGARIVTEGRASLEDNDRVAAKESTP